MHLFKVVMLGMSLTVICRAQTFTVIYSFTSNSTNGFRPEATLALSGTTLFGTTTDFGGRNRTVFKVNTDGTGFAVVLDSTTPDWDRPNGVIVSGNTLYGTTQYGNDSGPAPRGSIFRIDMDGSNYRVLKSFSTNEVGWPKAGLLLIGETLYGTASSGEAQRPGTVFKINTNGSGFMVLYNFTALSAGTNSDGAYPQADLVSDGTTLFGTTAAGGNQIRGTVFKVNTNGSGFAALHNFASTEGYDPHGHLVLNGDTLYGTMSSGGTEQKGTVFKVNTNGSDFMVLHNFSSSSAAQGGDGPWGGLILQGTTLYGTTTWVSSNGFGSIFKLETDGSGFEEMHGFQSADGRLPLGALVLNSNVLYGTAAIQGPDNGGTVFSLQLPTLPLPQPVMTSYSQTNGSFAFSWSTSVGKTYQVQCKTDMGSSSWSNLNGPIVATNTTLSAADVIGSDMQRFYRILLVQP